MKFRRKSAETPIDAGEEPAREPLDPTSGPFDHDQVDGDGIQRVDLGSLLVPAIADRELRLQVDEKTGVVRAVILTGKDGALEFQAFAAPRNGDLWSTVRPQISDDLTARGGSPEEQEGRWGTELVCQMPVQTPEGVKTQPSRIVGVNGPRWMLRATLLGRPAVEPEALQEWQDALAQIVVNRGPHAMPVGEALPVRLPDDARRTG